VLAAGAIHLYLYFDYFHRVATIGTLFLLNAAAALLVAAWVAGRDRLAPLVAGLLFSVGTLAAFFASVAVGLFGLPRAAERPLAGGGRSRRRPGHRRVPGPDRDPCPASFGLLRAAPRGVTD
jgi:hypothetical protein